MADFVGLCGELWRTLLSECPLYNGFSLRASVSSALKSSWRIMADYDAR